MGDPSPSPSHEHTRPHLRRRETHLNFRELFFLDGSTNLGPLEIKIDTSLDDIVERLWMREPSWPTNAQQNLMRLLHERMIFTAGDYLNLAAEEKKFIPVRIRVLLNKYVKVTKGHIHGREAPEIVKRSGNVIMAGILPVLAMLVVSDSRLVGESISSAIDFSGSLVPLTLFIYSPLFGGNLLPRVWSIPGRNARLFLVSHVLFAQISALLLLFSTAATSFEASSMMFVMNLFLLPFLMTFTVAAFRSLTPLLVVISQGIQLTLSISTSVRILDDNQAGIGNWQPYQIAVFVIYLFVAAVSILFWTIPTLIKEHILVDSWDYIKACFQAYCCNSGEEKMYIQDAISDIVSDKTEDDDTSSAQKLGIVITNAVSDTAYEEPNFTDSLDGCVYEETKKRHFKDPLCDFAQEETQLSHITDVIHNITDALGDNVLQEKEDKGKEKKEN